MKKILFLTNLKNGDPEEDLFLSEYLKNYFEVALCHPLQSKKHKGKIDLILIRNMWPTREYEEELDRILKYFDSKGVKIYNPLTAKGDIHGKDYLIDLFEQDYPVIPVTKSKEELNKLGNTEEYFIKPLRGGSSYGCKKVSKRELLAFNTEDYIIQPYIDIKHELSFYFIDNKFQHALYTPDKNKRWHLKPFVPTKEELAFAKKFIKWNNLNYGLQRIDACRTNDGQLLLMEIEDLCPFLSLLDLESQIRDKFLKNLVKSLKKLTS